MQLTNFTLKIIKKEEVHMLNNEQRKENFKVIYNIDYKFSIVNICNVTKRELRF